MSIKNDSWRKTAIKLLSDVDFMRKINNLDMDNLNEVEILDSFVYLNLQELELDNVRKYSQDLEKLIIWCQAMVSYHILIHPFTIRNDKCKNILI